MTVHTNELILIIIYYVTIIQVCQCSTYSDNEDRYSNQKFIKKQRQIAKFCNNNNNNRFNVFCIIFEQEYINTIKESMNKLLKEKKYQNNKLINNN